MELKMKHLTYIFGDKKYCKNCNTTSDKSFPLEMTHCIEGSEIGDPEDQERIDDMSKDYDVKDLSELQGVNITGGLSTMEYLRGIRYGEWPEGYLDEESKKDYKNASNTETD